MARHLILAAAAAAVLGLAAPAALAHGGSYNPPNAPGGVPPDSEILHPRVPVPTPPTRGSMTSWERWWDSNRFRFLDLRKPERLLDPRGTPTPEKGEDGEGEEDDFFSDEKKDGEKDVEKAPAGPPEIPARLFFEREVLPVVTRALRDRDAEVRSAAVMALGKMGFPRTLLDLQKSLRDPERDVRESALLALGMLGDSLAADGLKEVLLDPGADERARGYAAVGLGLIGGPEGGAALAAYLDPATDALRVGGIRRRPETESCVLAALGLAKYLPAAPAMRDIALLGRDVDGSKADAGVRSFALVGLAKMGDREALPVDKLITLLAEDRECLRQGAAIALGILGKPGDGVVTSALGAAALGDRDVNTRHLALLALARLGGDDAKKALRTCLGKAQRPDLPFAALAAGSLRDPDIGPDLLRLFRDEKDPEVRGALATGLGLAGFKEAVADLRAAAFGKGPRQLRNHCMVALGMLRDEASLEPLRKVVTEEWDPHVKLQAGLALGLLGDPEAPRRLLAVAKGATSILARGHACRILGLVGNRDSAKALCRFARDPKETGFLQMFAITGLGILAERTDVPLLSSVGFEFDPEIRNDALDEIADYM